MYLYCTKLAGSDKTNFETNHKSETTEINEIEIAETTYTNWTNYSTFSGYVATPIAWSDVKCHQIADKYILYLETSEPL